MTRSFVPPLETLPAAFYFPWHRASAECPNPSDWCRCIWPGKPGDPRAVLGLYGTNNRSIVDQHMDWLVANGVKVVAVEWNGPDNGTREEDDFVNHVLPSIEQRSLQFVVLYDLAIRMQPLGFPPNFNNETVRNRFIGDMQSFAASDRYFKHPKYLKFNNKPVIYVYITRAISPGADTPERLDFIQQAFDAAHAAARANGFAGLYLVADHLFWTGVSYEKLRRMTPSAVTSFAPVDPGFVPSGTPIIKAWADAMAGTPATPGLYPSALPFIRSVGLVDLTPGVFVQYDDRSNATEACQPLRTGQAYHLQSGADWSYMLDKAGMGQRWVAQIQRQTADCDVTFETNSDYKSLVWVYSFNEWAEGSGFEPLQSRTPAYPFGFGFDAIQRLKDGVSATSSDDGPPEPPVQESPEGMIEGLRPLFVWDGVQFADRYQLKVFNASDTEVVNVTMPETQYRPPDPGLTNGESHTWKVRARNSAGVWGDWSPLLGFTPVAPFTEPPGVPQTLAPSGCVDSLRPTFTWTAAERAEDYKIAINGDSTGEFIYLDVRGTSFVPPDDLTPGVDYRWHVKARNRIGETWSDTLYPQLHFTPLCGPSLSVTDVTVGEADGSAAFVVSLSAASGTTVTVNYATSDGSATAGSDYGPVSGSLSFAPGTTSQTVLVPIVADTRDEIDETFFLNLGAPVNAGIADGQGVATIRDDDDPPSVRIQSTLRIDPEGDTGERLANFVVTLSAESGKTVSVDFVTASGTATQDVDFAAASPGRVTFPPGTTTQNAAVRIYGDRVDELDETLQVTLTNPVNATLGTPTVSVGTIVDDDPMPAISIGDCSVVEGQSGSGYPGASPCAFPVTLSNPSSWPITVDFATAAGTATCCSDFEGRWGQVTFPAGTTGQTVIARALGDWLPEPNETFFVNLSNATNATIGRGQGLGTILDDEATRFYTVAPCRLLDTRQTGGFVVAGEKRTFAVTGSCGIPATAKAIAMNVTTLAQTAAGSLTLYPADLATPPTSNINFAANRPRANNGTLLLGTGGKATAQCYMPPGGQTHMIVDVFGYYQ